MVGTTRSHVSTFMNKFRKLGFIQYNGHLVVYNSLLNVVLHDNPHLQEAGRLTVRYGTAEPFPFRSSPRLTFLLGGAAVVWRLDPPDYCRDLKASGGWRLKRTSLRPLFAALLQSTPQSPWLLDRFARVPAVTVTAER